MTFLKTLSSGLAAAAVLAAAPASAEVITYDVNLNFNPTQTEAPPGAGSVGTITGTVTIDTSIPVRDLRIANQTGYDTTDVIGVNLTEATNDGIAAIGGGFGSPTYTSFTFTEYQPVTYIFFGSPISLNTSTATLSGGPGGATYLGLFFQTSASYLDGTLIGPSFQFVFPLPDGGTVLTGNFDSITSETKYLYGSVTVQAVPEPATWAMMLAGFAALGFASRRAGAGRSRLSERAL